MNIHSHSLPSSGKLTYTLTNDYLFRAAIQKNPEASKGLAAALLDIPLESIQELIVANPIILGEKVEDKDCILDIRLLLNNHTQINLEMQVGNLGNWTMRSVYYLSRLFTNLQSGKNYREALPSIHIGILTHTLFPENPQFYSKNYISDEKTHHVYTRNFGIHVLDLSQINNVSEEEKHTALYYWARMFLATTWEEVHAMAEKSDSLQSFSFTLKELSEDEQIRLRCEARERYYADQENAVHTGFQNGYKSGYDKASDSVLQLCSLLIEAGRIDDIKRCQTDNSFREALLKEFRLIAAEDPLSES